MKKPLFHLLAALMLFAVSPSFGRSLPVDLSALDVYVREGFEAEWTKAGPSGAIRAMASAADKDGAHRRLIEDGQESWFWIRGAKGSRSLRAADIGFSDIRKPAFFSRSPRPRTFTFCFPVNIPSADAQGHSLGVALPRIGENWAVYFNGVLLRSEVYLSSSGRIARERSMRNQVVEIPPSLVRAGQNLLAFRIIGDPSSERTGFYSTGGYLVGRYLSLIHPFSEYIDIILVSICFFFGLYHLVLFLRRSKEKYNLSFGISSILIAAYFLSKTSLPYHFCSDTRIIRAAEFTSVMTAFPVFVFFLERIILNRIRLFAAGYLLFCVLCAALSAVFDREAMLLWQVSMGFAFLFVVIADILMPLAGEIADAYKSGCGAFRSAARGLFLSVPGNLSLGVLFLFAAAILELLAGKTGRDIPLMKYGVFVVILGIVILLANRFLRVQSKAEELNANLEMKVEDRTKALVDANDELAAAMDELAAANVTLADANTRLEEARSETDGEISMAARVQENIFPEQSPQDETWDIACAFKPMSGVSGDLYNFHYHNGKLSGVSLLDVSGHGIASGLVTLLAHSVVARRFSEGWNEKLHHAMEKINDDLVADIGSIDNYLTGILVRFSGYDVEYVNAGHPDLLFRKGSNGRVKMVEPKEREFKGCFLGVPGMEHPFATVLFRMEREDAILLYSDCFCESMNSEGQQYGVQRIIQSFEKVSSRETAHDMIVHLIDGLVSWAGGEKFSDDLTVIVVKRKK